MTKNECEGLSLLRKIQISLAVAFWRKIKYNVDDECKAKTIYNDIKEDFETS